MQSLAHNIIKASPLSDGFSDGSKIKELMVWYTCTSGALEIVTKEQYNN